MKYDPRSHAIAVKALQSAEAKARKLIIQAEKIRADAQKYEDLASGLIDARRADVILSLGRAAYDDLVQHAPRGPDAVTEWLRSREFFVPAKEVEKIKSDLRYVRKEPEILPETNEGPQS